MDDSSDDSVGHGAGAGSSSSSSALKRKSETIVVSSENDEPSSDGTSEDTPDNAFDGASASAPASASASALDNAPDNASDAASSAGFRRHPKKKRRTKNTYKTWTAMGCFADDREDLFNTDKRELFCIACKEVISARHGPNVHVHLATAKHIRGWTLLQSPPPLSSSSSSSTISGAFARQAAAQAASSSASSSANSTAFAEALADAQAALAVHAVRNGVSKAAVERVYSEGASFIANTMWAKGRGMSGGTVARAFTRGTAMVNDALREWLVDAGYLCLSTDEASTLHLGRARPLGVMVYSSTKEKWVMLGALTDLDPDDEPGVNDGLTETGEVAGSGAGAGAGAGASSSASAAAAATAADSIDNTPSGIACRRVDNLLCSYGIEKATRIVGMVGDCAPFEEALAKKLGVPLILCVPHVLALALGTVNTRFPLFVACTNGLSTVVTSGGGLSRADALRAGGVSPSSIHCVSTRWLQLHDTGEYELSPVKGGDSADIVLERIRAVLRDSGDFIPAKDEAVRVSGTRRPVTAVLRDIRIALDVDTEDKSKWLRRGELEIRIVLALTKDLAAILRKACFDPHNINVTEILEDFDAALEKLGFVADVKGRASLLLHDMYKSMATIQYTDEEQKTLHATYCNAIVEAASSVRAVLTKYKADVFERLEQRRRFEPTTSPEELVLPTDGSPNDLAIAKFFGSIPESLKGGLVDDWFMYRKRWPELPADVKKKSMAQFWKDPAVSKRMVHLHQLGLWYACYPTSNVAIERAFGKMRTMEDVQRGSLSAENFEAELMHRVNSFLVDEVFGVAVGALRTQTTASARRVIGTSFSSSSSASAAAAAASAPAGTRRGGCGGERSGGGSGRG
jgi:hypothetical protein